MTRRLWTLPLLLLVGCDRAEIEDRSSSELTEQVVSAAESGERLSALEELSQRARLIASDTPPAENESLLAIRKVLAETDSHVVHAEASHYLGQLRDYDSLPVLIDSLAHESPEVRSAASKAIKEIVRFDSGYNAEEPPEQQGAAIAVYRRFWEGTKDTVLGERLRDPVKLRQHKEARAEKIREAARARWEKIKAERAANSEDETE